MKSIKRYLKNVSGQSLAEFAVTTAMMATLATTAAPKFSGVGEGAKEKKTLADIDKILKSNEKLKTDIIPIIESEKGIENLKEICEFKERIKVISFGSHDLAKSINLKVSDDENEILNYRKLIVSHSKDPIDTSYLNFKDLIGFEKSCNLAKSIGFAGKACIHPGQVDISNKIF